MPILWKTVKANINIGYFIFTIDPKILQRAEKYKTHIRKMASNTFGIDYDRQPADHLTEVISAICLNISTNDSAFFNGFPAPSLETDSKVIVFPFLDPFLARLSSQLLRNFLSNVAQISTSSSNSEDQISSDLKRLESVLQIYRPTFSLEKILQTALLHNIPFSRTVSKLPCYDFGHSEKRNRMWQLFTENTSHISTVLVTNKELTHSLLRSSSLPVPNQLVVNSEKQCSSALAKLSTPLVIKPSKTDRGIAVSIGLKTLEEVVKAYSIAKIYGPVVIEEQIPGDDFRLLVIKDNVVGVTKRMPGVLIGNGKDAIKVLFDKYLDLRKSDFFLKHFCKFGLESNEALQELATQDFSIHSIPKAGQRVTFRANSNISTGGTHENVTAMVHQDNLKMAVDAAKLVGLDIAGVDFISRDISKSWRDGEGGICEINPTPALSVEEGIEPIFRLICQGHNSLSIPVVVLLNKDTAPCKEIEKLTKNLQDIDGVRVVRDRDYTELSADLKVFTSAPKCSLVAFALSEQMIRTIGFTETSIDCIFFSKEQYTETSIRESCLFPLGMNSRLISLDDQVNYDQHVRELLKLID